MFVAFSFSINDPFTFLLSLLEIKALSNPWYYFFAISICAFNSLLKSKYSNLFNVAAFSNKSFSDKTSLPVKNSYLLTFLDHKAEILVVYLSKS